MREFIGTGSMPVLALRGMTVFPEQTVHFDVGRQKSVLALEAAMKVDQTILLIPQKNIVDDDPEMDQLYPIGTVAKVKQILKNQGEVLRVLVTGVCRARLLELTDTAPYLRGLIETIEEAEPTDSLRHRALRRDANTLYTSYLDLIEHPAQAVHLKMMASDSCGFIADAIAQNSGIDHPEKCNLLCQLNPVRRLEMADRY